MGGKQIILQMKYARIIDGIAKKLGLTLEQALDMVYESNTFRLINEGIADMHCRSDLYLIDEFVNEWKEKGKI